MHVHFVLRSVLSTTISELSPEMQAPAPTANGDQHNVPNIPPQARLVVCRTTTNCYTI